MDKDIMNLCVENLAQMQLEFLKEHCIGILKKVENLIKEEKFGEIKKMLTFSGAGDEMGDNNYFINFAYDEHILDIMDVIEMMESLLGRRKR